jgi:hypothetical protein
MSFDTIFNVPYPAHIILLLSAAYEISDDSSADISINHEGLPIVNHEHLNRSKLRIETCKWLAAKLAPGVYGPRILPTECPSCEMKMELSELSDDELIARAKEYLFVLTNA